MTYGFSKYHQSNAGARLGRFRGTLVGLRLRILVFFGPRERSSLLAALLRQFEHANRTPGLLWGDGWRGSFYHCVPDIRVEGPIVARFRF
jgi:hypothetical protein